MRNALIAGLLAFTLTMPGALRAQEPQFAEAAPASQLVAVEQIDGYRILAIGAGAAAGAVLTHMAIGSYVAPLMAKSGLSAMNGIAGDYLIARVTASLAGGAVGGLLGDRLYRGAGN